LHQVNQQVKNLWLNGNGLGTAAQLTPVGIKQVIGKEKLHVGPQNAGSEATLKG